MQKLYQIGKSLIEKDIGVEKFMAFDKAHFAVIRKV
jgi:hypothetical protein